jgi:hypothetical protein
MLWVSWPKLMAGAEGHATVSCGVDSGKNIFAKVISRILHWDYQPLVRNTRSPTYHAGSLRGITFRLWSLRRISSARVCAYSMRRLRGSDLCSLLISLLALSVLFVEPRLSVGQAGDWAAFF